MPTDRELRYAILLETRGTAEASDAVRAVADSAETALARIGTGAQREFAAYGRAAQQAATLAERTMTGTLGRIEDALIRTASTGRVEWRDMVEGMASDVAGLIIRTQITEPLSNSLSDALGGALGSAFGGSLFGSGAPGGSGGLFSGLLGGLFGAGAAFDRGRPLSDARLERFATGGIFGDGLVDRPTAFAMASGRFGLMGEAGPEAILPLQRLANGRLGVEAAAGPAASASVVINVDARGSADPEAVEAAGYRGARRALAEQAPGLVRASAALAQGRVVNDWQRRGGRFR
ncbi:MAG: hypothetical protein GVY13_19695 [Alphaproteobacteria bacterium]|nr:hypothetical protein [Alphaproteobacteria bacterium]